jgi:hypothetical protein
MRKVRRIALLTVLASMAFGVASVAQASASISWVQGEGQITAKTPTVTVTKKGGSSVSCTWNSITGWASNEGTQAQSYLDNALGKVRLSCAGGTEFTFYARMWTEKAISVGKEYAVYIEGGTSGWASPFGTWTQSLKAIGGVFVNGSGTTMSTLSFKETPIGKLKDLGSTELLLTATFTISRGASGLLTLTGS